MQFDIAKLMVDHPEMQDTIGFVNLQRIQSLDGWLAANSYLPMMNNINRCETSEDKLNQERRKRNFLKLKAAHLFVSPQDGILAPWQTSLFGRYSYVDTLEEIATKFEQFAVVNMRSTDEYVNDTFGLRTLDERGGLFLHEVPGVPHGAWIADTPQFDDPAQVCEFQPLFNKHIAPVLP